jgi:two-component system sensor histidine kinase KdpD
MKLQATFEGVVLVVVVSMACSLLYEIVSVTNLAMFFLLCVIVSALRWGAGAAAFVSLLSFASLDWVVLPPRFQFGAFDRQYFITLAVFLTVGQIISHLAERTRQQAAAARQSEEQTAILYTFSREISIYDDPGAVVRALEARLLEVCGCAGRVTLGAPPSAPEGGRLMLRTARAELGRVDLERPVPRELSHLVESLCSMAALALEQIRLAGDARQAHILQATDKLQTALLNSISHDLNTPLTSLSGSLDTLADASLSIPTETRQMLLELAREQTERLRRLVGNVLEMTRVEAGALHIHPMPTEPLDLIGATLERFEGEADHRTVSVDVPNDLPEVPVDLVLMSQVLSNLLDNAAKYSPESSSIELAAWSRQGKLEIEVRDRGVGIPSDDLERVFERFYRVQSPQSVQGTGLGLTISRGIVECHGGTIRACNRNGGGTVVAISLPLEAHDR